MMEVRVELTQGIQEAAAQLGISPEVWLQRAALRQALIEKDPESAPDIIAGLEAAWAGDYASDEKVEAVFAKHMGPEHG